MDDFDNLYGNTNSDQDNNSDSFSSDEKNEVNNANMDLTPEDDNNSFKKIDYNDSFQDKSEETVNSENYNWQNNTNSNSGNNYPPQTPPTYTYGQNNQPPFANNPYGMNYNQPPVNNPYNNQPSYTNSNPYPYANYNPGTNSQAPENGGSPKKSSKKTVLLIIGIIAAVIIVLFAGIIFMVFNPNQGSSEESTVSVSESTTIGNVEEAVTKSTPEVTSTSDSGVLTSKEIYDKISNSSVGVIVYDDSSDSESGEGSGVLLKEDKDGKYTYIITCAHVISGATKAVVQLSDNTEYEAEIIGADSRTDIGVLRIEASGLTLAEIGDSEKINVGDPVYAIGNPGGTSFAGSFTDGMISALDRPVNSETGYTMKCIQHTAAINPGNSGGALVNSYGQLIGINSSKIVSEDYEGMGFSVPSSVFVKIFNSIVTNGYVTDRAKLGISYVSASEYNSYYGMYVAIKGLPSGSLVVYSISSDSDLANSDVQKGDLIIAVNGKELDDSSVLAEAVESGSVGDTMTLTIARIEDDYKSHKEFDVEVKLVEDKDGSSSYEEETTTQQYSMEDYFRQYFGDNYDDYFGDNYGSGGYSGGNYYGW